MKQEEKDILLDIEGTDAEKPETEAAAEDSGQPVAEDSETDEEQSDVEKVRAVFEDDDDEHLNYNFARWLSGDFLTVRWFMRLLPFFLMIFVMLIVYVSNRYTSQRNMIRLEELNAKLTAIRYETMTRSAQLKQRTRQSKVLEILKTTPDSDLKRSSTPPIFIHKNADAE